MAADNSAAWKLFQQAWQQLHIRKQATVATLPMTQEAFAQWQQKDTTHQRSLFVLALAVRLMLEPTAKDLKAQAIIRTLVKEFEVNRLAKEAKQCTPQINQYSLIMLRALAALSGQLESQALRDLIQAGETLKLDIQLPSLPQLKETSLWQQKAIQSLQPDLLAADLLQYALTEPAEDQAGVWQYLGLEAATNPAEASSVLGRLIHDARYVLQQPWLLKTLTDWVCQEPERCRKLNDALNRNYLEPTLLPLAIATSRVLLEQENSPQTQAQHLNNLSNRLADDGQRQQALTAIQRAAEIREQLAAGNFAAYAPDLASSLNNLSNRLADSNRVKELMEIRAKLQKIKQRILDEKIQVPAAHAWLFEQES